MIKEGEWDIAIKTAVLPTAVTSEQLQCRQAGRRLFFHSPKTVPPSPTVAALPSTFFPFPPLGKIPFLGELGEGRKKHSSSPFPTVRSCHQQAAAATDEKEGGRETERKREALPPGYGKKGGGGGGGGHATKNSESSSLIPSPPFFFPFDPSKSFHNRSPSLHLIILLLRRCRAKRENPHRLSRSHRVRWYKRVTPNSRD